MENKKDFLGTDPVGKLMFRLAIPTVVAQLVNMLYSVFDRVFIGHMPNDGSLALTGIGVCTPIIMVVSAFAALVSAGGAPRASISMGKKDLAHAENILGNCFSLQIIISALLTVILLIFGRDFLLAFGASENTIEYAVDYLSIYAIGTVFVQSTLGMNAFITAQGFTKISMLAVVIGAVCNIALDPLFIFAFDMGVRGAALATVISQAISCAWVMLFLTGKKTYLRIRRKNLRLSPSVVLPCIALGSAVFIMQASESVISVCFNASLLKYGGDIAVGAMTILSSVMMFAMLPLQGIAQGAQPILSYNFGAKNPGRVKKTFWILFASCTMYSTVLWLFVIIAPKALVSVITPDKELIAFAAKALRVYMACMLLFGIQIACQMTFTSIGNAKSSIVVAVMRKFVLLLPLIYIMPHVASDPTMGVYMAEPVADAIAVAFTAILFSFQFKKAMRSLELKYAE